MEYNKHAAALPSVLATANVSGIYALVERRMPQHVGKFTFKAMEGDGDAFVLSDTKGGKGGITVECTTTNACARGLYTCVHNDLFFSLLSTETR